MGKRPKGESSMKNLALVSVLFCGFLVAGSGCMEGLPLPADDGGGDDVDNPDSGVPTEDPDACPVSPDASTPPAPIVDVTATCTTIMSGDSCTVNWVSSNADDCWSLGPNNQHVTQLTNGSWLLYPTTTTTYTIYCTGPGGDASDSVTVTVNPLPELPVVTISTVIGSSLTEGQTGYFVVHRVGGNTNSALTVNLNVSGTALGGTDYQSMLTSVTLAANVVSEFVPVVTIDDQINEVSETVILTLVGGSSYTLGSPINGTITIADNDDPTPSCDDGLSWTGDVCNSDGSCTHWPIDCGGMEVQLEYGQTITGSVTCGYWDGFGVSPADADNIGWYNTTSAWVNAPMHACAVDECYDSAGHAVRVNIRIKWNGVTFQNQTINHLLKGTWDGHNLQQ